MTADYDVAVIGAGIIGASVACQLSADCRVVLLEQESQPGYHSSGRSAAVLLPPYGGQVTRALTAASIDFLSDPPEGFAEFPLLTPRGAIFLANPRQLLLLHHWTPSDTASTAQVLSVAEAVKLVPILQTHDIAAVVSLPDVRDIDAAGLLQGYLKLLRKQGGTLRVQSRVEAIGRAEGLWVLSCSSGPIRAKTVVNAAGAWADDIATLAGADARGLVSLRRTMVVVDGPVGVDVRQWPLVGDVAESFYFKPDAGRIVVSPADRSPMVAQDAQPEEWDIAVAVDRLETATTLSVRRVVHQWAGLRTVSPDEAPILGFDPGIPDFLWAAGFGGFGIQTAPAAGRICAALVTGKAFPAELVERGLDVERLSPRRFEPSRP